MNLKRILSTVLVIALVLGTMSFTVMADNCDVWDGSVNTDWYNTTDTEFVITTGAQLAGFAKLVNDGTDSFKGKTVKLAADIDLNQVDWTSIGTSANPFLGTFDGGEKTIFNLWGAADANGLFGYTSSGNRADNTGTEAIVKNFTINGAVITDNAQLHNGAAAVIGCGNMHTTVKNVTVTGEIIITGARSGGILGYAYSGAIIDDCHVDGASENMDSHIDALYWACGGIMGFTSNEGTVEITNSSVKNVNINAVNHYGAGGILGNGSGGKVENVLVSNVTCSVAYAEDAVYYVSGGPTATGSVIVSGVTAKVNGVEVEVTGENLSNATLNPPIEVNGEYFNDLAAAFKAVNSEAVINILSDITISTKWNANFGRGSAAGTFNNNPVTINGNDHIIKFTGEINDGYNQMAILRNTADLTVNDLTIDASEAISAWNNRINVISVDSGDLTVDGCEFIGNPNYTKGWAIIFGEGTGDLSDTEISVTNSSFKNFKYGVSDSQAGTEDVASVEISNSVFEAASINVSASEEVTITDNKMDGGYIKVSSYTQSPQQNLIVTVTGNTLDEDFAADNQIQAGTVINAQEGFVLPVATVSGKKYMTLKSAVAAAKDGEIVYLMPGTYEDEITVNTSITITGDPNYGISTPSTKAAIEKPVIKISDVTNGGVEYHAPNVTFDNLVFEVSENATGAGWNISALGYYYEIVKDRDGLTVTNCDFINKSKLSLGAIAANFGEYTVKNNTFKNFTTGVWSFVDHGEAKNVVISDNTYEGVENLVNIYYGAPANGTASVTVTDNKVTDDGEAKIYVGDFGQTKATPATAYNNVVITGNDAEIILGNYAEDSFNDTVENNKSVVYDYENEDVLRNLEQAGVPEGEVYVGYGSDSQIVFKVVDGIVYGAAKFLKVEFEKADTDAAGNDTDENADLYNINIKANDKDMINRLNSADLQFVLTQVHGKNDFEIIASNKEVAVNPVDNSKVRYEFHYNGKTGVTTDTDTIITIGQVKVTGYGTYNFKVDGNVTTNAAHSTKMENNIVDTFIPDGDLTVANQGDLDISDDTITNVTIAVPARDLTIKVDFPNSVVKNDAEYQDMTVVVSGGDLDKDIEIKLGDTDLDVALTYNEKADAKYTVDVETDGGYTILLSDVLAVNNAYTVTVSGAGYRTARYTVTMTEDKTLRFWNNVMDEAQFVEIGKESSKVNVTYLAGDIVKDNVINIYDLSAVVSYFGSTSTVENKYAKYDLNRDGIIDSKDVAYVLVSWGK
ncbi:MAG: hypothetical protein E7411_00210 [Ruminococcaceae bacterium]|nr:hypothetical protein [Oscillospiraceae bacterium]